MGTYKTEPNERSVLFQSTNGEPGLWHDEAFEAQTRRLATRMLRFTRLVRKKRLPGWLVTIRHNALFRDGPLPSCTLPRESEQYLPHSVSLSVFLVVRRELRVDAHRVEQRDDARGEQRQERPVKHVLDAWEPDDRDRDVAERAAERAGLGREQSGVERALRERLRDRLGEQRHVDALEHVRRDEDEDASGHELHDRVVPVAHDRADADNHRELRHHDHLAVLVPIREPAHADVRREHEQPERREVQPRVGRVPLEVELRDSRRGHEQALEHELEHDVDHERRDHRHIAPERRQRRRLGLGGPKQRARLERDRGDKVDAPEREHDEARRGLGRHEHAAERKVRRVVERRGERRAGRHAERARGHEERGRLRALVARVVVRDVAPVDRARAAKAVEQAAGDRHRDAVAVEREAVEQVPEHETHGREHERRLVRPVRPPTVEHGAHERRDRRHADNHAAERGLTAERRRIVPACRRDDVVVGHVQERAEHVDEARDLGAAFPACERLVRGLVLILGRLAVEDQRLRRDRLDVLRRLLQPAPRELDLAQHRLVLRDAAREARRDDGAGVAPRRAERELELDFAQLGERGADRRDDGRDALVMVELLEVRGLRVRARREVRAHDLVLFERLVVLLEDLADARGVQLDKVQQLHEVVADFAKPVGRSS
ncbi:hypothetical protein PybrP1_001054 [[Pythium] brassicae (nom. inval.)]|nr:hypothetical protein PybrP1_001054 [[Pythium] brassicae (nom. inval.)]